MLDVPELAGTRWSVEVLDADGQALAGRDETALLPTASLPKVFLLTEVAERIAAGELDPAEELDRRRVAAVGDSGLWQHLVVETLPVADVAALVGSVSDNLATNVLLERVGLDAVQRRARSLAPGGSMLHDQVRYVRRPADPPTLSEGCARDYAGWFRGLDSARPADGLVRRWLSSGTDLSMVAGAFDLDPLGAPRALAQDRHRPRGARRRGHDHVERPHGVVRRPLRVGWQGDLGHTRAGRHACRGDVDPRGAGGLTRGFGAVWTSTASFERVGRFGLI